MLAMTAFRKLMIKPFLRRQDATDTTQSAQLLEVALSN
jgi:hypothetical protein